jgi:hypothetical protein
MPASWNQIATWLEQIEAVRRAACVLAGYGRQAVQ